MQISCIMKSRKSLKREKILAVFSNADLLSADEVYAKLRDIDRATVYRNINYFVKQGLLREVSVKKGIVLYEIMKDDHQHFMCSNCSKIIPVDIDRTALLTIIPNNNQFRIDDYEVNIKGKCRDCDKRVEKKQNAKN